MKTRKGFLPVLVLLALAAKAEIRLPAVIGSNMVLQQKTKAKLWGWGNPGEKVFITTTWSSNVDSTKVNGEGKWAIALATPVAGGPFTLTIRGDNTLVLQNVMVGEVWVCSGQSNMEMNFLWGLPQMREDIPTAANPAIRFFQVPRSTAETPQERGEGFWNVCDSNTVKSFSAVAYYFGRKLNAGLNVPVGLVHASWGGTPAEAWTPAEEVAKEPVLNTAAQKLKPSNGWPVTPGAAYNGMITPLLNFPAAGVIWYQGESNTGTAASYRQLFATLINSWRKKWHSELPFYFVQLAPYAYGNRNVAALLREAQTQTLTVPKTGMVVTTDLADDTADIHPRNKRDVGYRLANLALAQTYGRPLDGVQSPLFSSMTVNGSQAVLSFVYAEKGLVQTGRTADGFFVAGNDKIFYPAKARIRGNEVVVSSPAVKTPVAVRYAFSNTAKGNVFSRYGVPLSPFRTDNWDVDTTSVN